MSGSSHSFQPRLLSSRNHVTSVAYEADLDPALLEPDDLVAEALAWRLDLAREPLIGQAHRGSGSANQAGLSHGLILVA
jgi:hypothetical protein